MLVSDIVRRVRESAGDIGVLQFSNATLTDWINDAVRECVIENSLLQSKATSSTVIGQKDYNLPVDIFKIHSVWYDTVKLEVCTLEQWEALYGTESPSGPPTHCYVYAGVLTLGSTPAEVKPLVINYTKLPAAITYDGTNWNPTTPSIPEYYHNRLVAYCLAQVAMQDDDFPKYQALMAEFQTGVRDLKSAKDQEDDLYPFINVSPRDMGESLLGWW